MTAGISGRASGCAPGALVLAPVLTALALATGPAQAQFRLRLPEPPEWSLVEPAPVDSHSHTISYGGTLFRLEVGAPIGSIYRVGLRQPVAELRWQSAAVRSREFDVAAHNRLRKLGYRVVDPADSPFGHQSSHTARFQLGVVVNGVRGDLYTRMRGSAISEQSYGVATVELEVQLLDTDTQKIVFRGAYRGWGLEQGQNPAPVPAALLNGIDHALADPAFVALLRDDEQGAVGAPAETLAISRCDAPQAGRLPEAVEALLSTVVDIRAGLGTGSGVIISPDGYLLTAAHVVQERESVLVQVAGGLELEARTIRTDHARDIALLQLPGRNHRCAILAAEPADVGSEIYAIGNPLGLGRSVARGIVSGHQRFGEVSLLQTDASVNPGTSGGPLFDQQGQVQAIISAKISGSEVEGLAFGIPAAVALQRLGLRLE